MTEQEIAAKEKQPLEGQEKTRAGRFFLPKVDIYEFDDSIKLWVDMPGVKESDVKVTLKDGVLTITGTVSTNVYEKLSAGAHTSQGRAGAASPDRGQGGLTSNGGISSDGLEGPVCHPRGRA